MKIHHVALVCRSEENSDQFYHEVLGLEKMPPRQLTSDLAEKLFRLRGEYQILNYVGEGIHFEIFISDGSEGSRNRLGHICLEVENRNTLLERCDAKGIKAVKAARGDSMIVFIADADGNLFELKEKKR